MSNNKWIGAEKKIPSNRSETIYFIAAVSLKVVFIRWLIQSHLRHINRKSNFETIQIQCDNYLNGWKSVQNRVFNPLQFTHRFFIVFLTFVRIFSTTTDMGIIKTNRGIISSSVRNQEFFGLCSVFVRSWKYLTTYFILKEIKNVSSARIAWIPATCIVYPKNFPILLMLKYGPQTEPLLNTSYQCIAMWF